MADNEFLNGVRVEQFIKQNNDQLSSTLGDVSKNITKSVKSILANQKTQITSLKSIDKSSKSINKSMTKLLKSQEQLLKALTKKNNDSGQNGESKSIAKALSTLAKSGKPKKSSFKKGKTYDKDNNTKFGQMNKKLDIISKKGILGGLGNGLGGLLAVGGIIGALLTGNVDMLSTPVRFLSKAMATLAQKVSSTFTSMGAKLAGKLNKIPGLKKFFGEKVTDKVVKEGAEKAAKKGAQTTVKETVKKGAKKNLSRKARKKATKKAMDKAAKETAEAVAKKAATKKAAQLAGKTVATKGTAKLVAKTASNSLPLIGALVSLPFAVSRALKGDFVGAGMEVGAGASGFLNLVAPGAGTAVGVGIEAAMMARDLGMIGDEKGAKAKHKARKNKKLQNKKLQNSGKASPKADGSYLRGNFGLPRNIGSGGLPSHGLDMTKRSSDAYYTESGVRLGGIKNDVWHNFNGMFGEYNSLMNEQYPGHRNKWGMRGDTVQINSGYRSIAEQTELYNTYLKEKSAGLNPDPVARPGASMHNYGYAMDINSPEANIMGGNGAVNLKVPGYSNLMQKWGFDRPVAGEAWHIEPKNLNYAKARSGISSTGDSASHTDPLADAVDGINVPQGKLASKVKGDAPIKVQLTPADIDAMAVAFGKQLKSMPKKNGGVVATNQGSPRSNL